MMVNVHRNRKAYQGRGDGRGGGYGGGGRGEREIIYLSLHCHHKTVSK